MHTLKEHWENIYSSKLPGEVSWTQAYPKISLDLIRNLDLPKSASIIDVGGGDSNLADILVEEGFSNITVLDISEKALTRSKQRLGNNSNKIRWISNNILDFNPDTVYDVWHDRAAFHFLLSQEDIGKYVSIAAKAVINYMILGTFSDNGPKRCSGLDVHQYNEQSLESCFRNNFRKVNCVTEDHITPFNTRQNFLFCSFNKIK